MTYNHRSMIEDCESLAKRKYEGMCREDILAYECGLLRGVVQTLCILLNQHEGLIEAQKAIIETYTGVNNDNRDSTKH
jgi:hypothetical protein